MVQTEKLRPALVPALLGQDFFLSGYRIFTRLGTQASSLRGLRILRSDTDKRLMVVSGNLLTHYAYQHCRVSFREEGSELEVKITTPDAQADLEVSADLAHRPAPLPGGTPFDNEQDARRFAGPLPYTFDYEKETGSIIMIRGVRERWNPQPVRVMVKRCTFLEQQPFCRAVPRLANAFYLENVPYRWERGVRTAVRTV
jgi:hypothetical protein